MLAASIASVAIFGLPLGIDFSGGSLSEITFLPDEEGTVNIPSREALEQQIAELDLGSVAIQRIGEQSFLMRFSEIDEETHEQLLARIGELEGVNVREERFESVGPIIGRETRNKSLQAIGLVLVMIVAYIAWAFRKISYPIGSWKYGIVALVTLFHDVVIAVGLTALIGSFLGWEVGVPFIAALLTIVGYSVNDTIVVFDRVRENLHTGARTESFEDLVGRSVRETLVRSLNTSATTLFVLAAILVFGGASVQQFVSVLMIGIAIGTYSSVALASPLLVSWAQFQQRAAR